MFDNRPVIELRPVRIIRLEHTCVVNPLIIGIFGILQQRPERAGSISPPSIPLEPSRRHKCDRDGPQRK